MNKEAKNITIKDVARLAGVSKGTVDRVVHNRGEVSQQSRERVLEVIEQIGYRPNLYASMLATKRHYRLVCLIPYFEPGEYWELVHRGIVRAEEKARGYNIGIETIFYHQFDIESFRKGCRAVLDAMPSAVLFAPTYRDETLALNAELQARAVPYVYIDSRIEGCNYLAYFGMPMRQSGYLGASLLTDCGRAAGEVASFRIADNDIPQDNPTHRRREGFFDYIAQHAPDCRVSDVFIRPHDALFNLRAMDAFFEANPGVRNLITFNSRVHLIAEYLEKRGLKDCTLVGYDMLDRNFDAVRRGTVKYLITQRTETQVYRGINTIIDYLIQKRQPASKDNAMAMDIIMRDNVDYYFDMFES